MAPHPPKSAQFRPIFGKNRPATKRTQTAQKCPIPPNRPRGKCPDSSGDKTACIVSLQAKIDGLGGVPYGWIKIYEVLLFAFYNHCDPGQMRRQACKGP
jgi:hypothetical protein